MKNSNYKNHVSNARLIRNKESTKAFKKISERHREIWCIFTNTRQIQCALRTHSYPIYLHATQIFGRNIFIKIKMNNYFSYFDHIYWIKKLFSYFNLI